MRELKSWFLYFDSEGWHLSGVDSLEIKLSFTEREGWCLRSYFTSAIVIFEKRTQKHYRCWFRDIDISRQFKTIAQYGLHPNPKYIWHAINDALACSHQYSQGILKVYDMDALREFYKNMYEDVCLEALSGIVSSAFREQDTTDAHDAC